MFKKILIANRGEIAVRVIRACREMGIEPVAVYSDADADALHVRSVHEAHRLGPAPARESYLNIEAVMEAARKSGAGALHPGYGFLAERAELAEACAAAKITFIGPPAKVIRLLGDKVASKKLMREAGVPVVPGSDSGSTDLEALEGEAKSIPYPLLVKAAAGGGGKGMRVVRSPRELRASLEGASREAAAAFGDATVFLERYLEDPRHVEVQVMADTHDNVLALGERECSIQRRHQKILEESPSSALDGPGRQALLDAAVRAARAAGYVNAGTVEFLLAPDGSFHFLEVNTRLQVEHPVTECVTGLDLVQMQIAVAAGEKLKPKQEDIQPRGHAVEVRLYAEDPAHGFLPTSGEVTAFEPPQGPGVRNDLGTFAGDRVGIHYDPMLAKLIVWAGTRPEAYARLARALDEYRVSGLVTNLDFLRWLAARPEVLKGTATTGFLDRTPYAPERRASAPESWLRACAALFAGADGSAAPTPWRAGRQDMPVRLRAGGRDFDCAVSDLGGRRWQVSLDGRVECVTARPGAAGLLNVEAEGAAHELSYSRRGARVTARGFGYSGECELTPPPEGAAAHHRHHGALSLTAPMPGAIVRLEVAEGQDVHAHQRLLVLEAMKMEHTLVAPEAGRVMRLPHKAGDVVALGEVLVEMEEK